jgi:hypothetical protein
MTTHPGPEQHSDTHRLTSAEFDALFKQLQDATARGPQDRRGALNNLTPAHVLAAIAEVRSGRTVSLAAPIETVASRDNPEPCVHEMVGAGDRMAAPGLNFAMDHFAMNVHGNADSHIDALCHVIYDGAMYNGVHPGTVTTGGETALSIDVARDGIAGRGVLLDIPRVRGVSWLEPGDSVTVADLEAAERAQHVRMRTGDLLFVRVGHRRRRDELGRGTRRRLAPDCIRPRCRCWPNAGSPRWAATATTTPLPAPPQASSSRSTSSPSTRWACIYWTTCGSRNWCRAAWTRTAGHSSASSPHCDCRRRPVPQSTPSRSSNRNYLSRLHR